MPDHSGWANIAFGFKGSVWQDEDTFQVVYEQGDVLLGVDGPGSDTVLVSAQFRNPKRSLELTWTRGEPKPWAQVAELASEPLVANRR